MNYSKVYVYIYVCNYMYIGYKPLTNWEAHPSMVYMGIIWGYVWGFLMGTNEQ